MYASLNDVSSFDCVSLTPDVSAFTDVKHHLEFVSTSQQRVRVCH